MGSTYVRKNPEVGNMTDGIYICENKRCSGYNEPFTAMHFKEYRLATGKSVKCPVCGNVATWQNDVLVSNNGGKTWTKPTGTSWEGRGYRREGK